VKTVKPTPFPSNPELRNPKQLGDAVRAARTASGLTLIDAALSVGVAKQTLSDLENGKPTVGLGIALDIAAQLGVSLFVFPKQARSRVLNQLKDTDAS
jgi:transcriptional regulator with XRE-family HTH domain